MGTFKKRAKTALPQPEEENLLDLCCILSPWRCPVIHVISVLERPRSVLMIFLGDALDEPLKVGCTRGRIHPLCFPKYLLYIRDFSHTNHPFTEPKWPVFFTSCCLTNHIEKSCTSFPIPCPKRRVKQGEVENCYKTSGSLLHLCSSVFLHIFVHKSPTLLYILVSSNPGWASRRRQWHLGSQEGPCEF